MGGVKRMLPDDWGQEGPNEEEEWEEYVISVIRSTMKKYVCIGNETTEADWLPRWYKIPHEECVLLTESQWSQNIKQHAGKETIILRPLPEGTDYVHYLKTLKTERLLNGNDVRKY